MNQTCDPSEYRITLAVDRELPLEAQIDSMFKRFAEAEWGPGSSITYTTPMHIQTGNNYTSVVQLRSLFPHITKMKEEGWVDIIDNAVILTKLGYVEAQTRYGEGKK
ncbi:hypothetical protein [Burkholderia cepacia]|uniref:hypothetical protein n=1 Tax=Burkholderia cepacia TaxID=292 RepID=UPI002AB13CFE|nr:hypothetical protein [Burkholderia cepacia]